jgi:hypothetical protein
MGKMEFLGKATSQCPRKCQGGCLETDPVRNVGRCFTNPTIRYCPRKDPIAISDRHQISSMNLGNTIHPCKRVALACLCLLVKSYGSPFGCSGTNCSRHNNLTIKRPHGRLSRNVEEVGEIGPRLTVKDTKKTQRTLASSRKYLIVSPMCPRQICSLYRLGWRPTPSSDARTLVVRLDGGYCLAVR